jgi:hypothetical protein
VNPYQALPLAPETAAASTIPGTTVKHRETQDSNGTLLAVTDTYYRGTNRILRISTYKKAHGRYNVGGGWRTYYMDNQPVLVEDHKNPGGDSTLRVYGKTADLSNFEQFTRHPDGSAVPVSSDELAKLKEEDRQTEADLKAFVGILEDS